MTEQKVAASPSELRSLNLSGLVLDKGDKIVTKFEKGQTRSSTEALRAVLVSTTVSGEKSSFGYLEKIDQIKKELGDLLERGDVKQILSDVLGVGVESDFWNRELEFGANYVENRQMLIEAGVDGETIKDIEATSKELFEKDGMGDNSLKKIGENETNAMLLKLLSGLIKAEKSGKGFDGYIDLMERRLLAQRLKNRDVLEKPLNPSDIKPSSVEKFWGYLKQHQAN